METKYSQPQEGLLFIPDISGFTNFVTHTEAQHAQHIIEELLGVLIDANQIGMEVSEIEGDAILFFRFDQAPKAGELLDQVQRMFIAFHSQLKKYESQRICHCGACRSTHQLTLKFIAHFGEFSKNQIKEHQKLFGREVIVAHRLLKNDIENHEYLMVTQNLITACPTWDDFEALCWAEVETSQQEYDSGKVAYSHLPLAPLFKHVPEPQTADFGLVGEQIELGEIEGSIEAPMEMAFNVLIDLPFRNQWQEGLDPNWTIDHLNTQIAQHGSTHRCFIGGPVIITHDIKSQEDVIRYTETITKDQVATVVTLRRLGNKMTNMKINIFMKRHWLKEKIFKLIFKPRMEKALKISLKNLNDYCKQLLAEGKEHPYSIVLPTSQTRVIQQ